MESEGDRFSYKTRYRVDPGDVHIVVVQFVGGICDECAGSVQVSAIVSAFDFHYMRF